MDSNRNSGGEEVFEPEDLELPEEHVEEIEENRYLIDTSDDGSTNDQAADHIEESPTEQAGGGQNQTLHTARIRLNTSAGTSTHRVTGETIEELLVEMLLQTGRSEADREEVEKAARSVLDRM